MNLNKTNLISLVIFGFIGGFCGDGWIYAQSKKELDFKWNDELHRCEDKNGQLGANFNYVGECGFVNGIDLQNKNYDNQNFNGAKLYSIDFTGSSFVGAQFSGAHIVDTSFRKAKFGRSDKGEFPRETEFNDANIDRTDFSEARFESTSMQSVTLNESFFNDVALDELKFRDSRITRTEFKRVKAKGRIEFSSHLDQVVFEDWSMEAKWSGEEGEEDREDETGISFSSTMGVNVAFKRCAFYNASFWGANFAGVEILASETKNSRFSNVNFTGGNFAGTKFIAVEMFHVKFVRSDLGGATFDAASIEGEGVSFLQALYDDATLPFAKNFPLAVKLGLYKKPY